MISIKKSFADCSRCPLFQCPSCILETNCKNDMSKVEIVFVAENPGKDEVDKEVPLIGRAGQTFRKFFKKYNLNKLKYLLTNVVLCETLDSEGNTGNPIKEVIDLCKVNCMEIIKACDPKLIVLMGSSAMNAFGIEGSVTEKRSRFYEWEKYPVFVTFHPSYVNRKQSDLPKFEEDIKKVAEFMTGEKLEVATTKHRDTKIEKGIFRYRIPDKFYTSEYRLVDVQYLRTTKEVLYIFRDKDNKKVYHKETDMYVYYKAPDGMPLKKTMSYDIMEQVRVPYEMKNTLDHEKCFEGDLRITVKHALDYYYYNEGDPKDKNMNAMFFDIEIDTGDRTVFPAPELAEYPINMFTSIHNGKTITYVLDNKTEPIEKKENIEYKIFNSEKEMMIQFIKDFKETDPDYISGWNCISENEPIFLYDRILNMKDVTKNMALKQNGVIKNKVFTGEKEKYRIELINGSKIDSSINHIFPIYSKPKKCYYTKEKLNDTKKDMPLKDIIELTHTNDVYLKIDLKKNENKTYIWRDYLLENIERLISYDLIDIKIIDKELIDKIKKSGLHKKFLKHADYGWGKRCLKHNFWSYKNVKDLISIEEIRNQIEKYDEQIFKIGANNNDRFYNLNINITEEIANDFLQLLGFLYTDGFWSKYDDEFHFDNKDFDNAYNYNLIMNEFRRFPYTNINHKWNKRDNLYTFEFGFTNKFLLLMPMIYNTDRKKEINLEILSRFSQEQFFSFISGVIDGDGSVLKAALYLHNFENNGNDCYKLHVLLTWNGVFSYLRKNYVMIPRITINKKLLKNLRLFHSARKKYGNAIDLREAKNSIAKVLHKFFYEECVLLKIKTIENTKEMARMYDIETETHYFLCNGIETHNCLSFDLQYIFNRLPKIGIKRDSLSNFSEFYIDAKRWIARLPGCICIDQDFLYRMFTFTKLENYKLGFVAEHELKIGKIDLPLPINQMYWKMLNKTIDYNIRDTELLDKLEQKLSHIKLFNELRIICNTSFEAMGSFGEIDSLMISFLRNRGIASRDSYNIEREKEKYKGAFVFEAIPAIYDYVTDFDFASLYPSIIITYNIGTNSFVMKTRDSATGYDITYHPENLPEKIGMIIDPLGEAKEVEMPKAELFKQIENENLVFTINGCFFKNHKTELSYFAEVVEMIMGSRKEYKIKMFDAIVSKNKELESFYHTRQLVYKVLANTLYGVIANKAFRFFDLSLASAITLSGQETLKTSIIQGDAKLKNMAGLEEYKQPLELTKTEMFSDVMPNRSNRFIITGDTDSIFCCFNEMKAKKTAENLRAWCDEVEKFLNDSVIIDLVKKHRVPLEFNRLRLKNEMIISRGLFLTKKRYIIRVVSQEGKDVDKTIYIGVEIKRSDCPRKSKEFLSELADLILKSNEKLSPIKLLNYVHSKEKEFRHLISSGDKSIARPVSFGKELEDYKVIPQGVRAMEAWNNIVYDIHKTGAKAYMFFVSGLDREKAPREIMERYEKYVGDGGDLKVIAVPDEEVRLPSYFIPDMKHTLKYAFTDRYEMMLKPLFIAKEDKSVLKI